MKRFNKWNLMWIGLLLLVPVMAWAQYGQRMPVPQQPQFSMPWYWTLYQSRALQHVLAVIFGGLLGALFSDKMRELRRLLFFSLLGIAVLIGILMNATMGNIALFIAAFVAAYMALKERLAPKNWVKPTTFGSAEWADLKHLQQHGLIGKDGFFLGIFEDRGASYPLHYTSDRHLLTVAPTRSGKGTTAIIPNLLTYEGSGLIIDPKGENAMITAVRRGAGDPALNIPGMGQKVHVVDPWGITGLAASRFNPMDWLDPKDEDISENALMLADSIIAVHRGKQDQYWDEEAKSLLMGIALYVATDAREAENRSLGRVRDIISMGETELAEIMERMLESENSIVRSTVDRLQSKDPKLRSSVIASLQAHTHFLDSPRIRESLKVSDFKFEDLKTSRMTVYLVLPADRLQPFGRWLRLLVQQALTVNARNIEVKPEKPILFLLDEMAALGHLTMVEQAFSLMAGFGMQLWGVVQDLSQLDRIYDKGWETFIGNSGVLQYFGSRDHKTAEYFSKLCGVETIEKFSFTRALAKAFGYSSSSGGQGGSSSSGTTYTSSDTVDVAQRHLAYPDELMVLRDNKQLVMIENFNPIRGKKINWFEDDAIKTLGVNLQKS